MATNVTNMTFRHFHSEYKDCVTWEIRDWEHIHEYFFRVGKTQFNSRSNICCVRFWSVSISPFVSKGNIVGGMLWDGSGYHHVCAWECVGWMLPHLFPLLTQVLLRLLAGYCCAKVTYFTLSYSLYTIFRNQTRSKIFNYAFYSTTTKI